MCQERPHDQFRQDLEATWLMLSCCYVKRVSVQYKGGGTYSIRLGSRLEQQR